MTDRNPYLLLGVDYGASGDEARRAFAIAAKRVRQSGGNGSIDDLSWALHQIESRSGAGSDDLAVYRVPADPAAFDPAGWGLFRPPPKPAGRWAGPPTAADRDELTGAAAREVAAAVWQEVAARANVMGLLYDIEESGE